jgi:hypothetical protein
VEEICPPFAILQFFERSAALFSQIYVLGEAVCYEYVNETPLD